MSEVNGYKNYETFAVSMFLSGDYTGQATADAAQEISMAEYVDPSETSEYWTRAQSQLYSIESAIKDFVCSLVETDGASLASDLLTSALENVDWRRLAEHQFEIARFES